jgi:hypothetical protein
LSLFLNKDWLDSIEIKEFEFSNPKLTPLSPGEEAAGSIVHLLSNPWDNPQAHFDLLYLKISPLSVYEPSSAFLLLCGLILLFLWRGGYSSHWLFAFRKT